MTTTITYREPELRRVQHAALRVCLLPGWNVPGYAGRCKVETVSHAVAQNIPFSWAAAFGTF